MLSARITRITRKGLQSKRATASLLIKTISSCRKNRVCCCSGARKCSVQNHKLDIQKRNKLLVSRFWVRIQKTQLTALWWSAVSLLLKCTRECPVECWSLRGQHLQASCGAWVGANLRGNTIDCGTVWKPSYFIVPGIQWALIAETPLTAGSFCRAALDHPIYSPWAMRALCA
jgi:hypothetical protein